MKTFKLIGLALLAVMMCMNFTACGKSGNEEEPPAPSKQPIEEFTQGDMNFTEKAGEQTFSFTANADWIVSVASTSGGNTWCTASPTKGNAGSQTVKISVTENDTYDDRSVTITLKSGNESKSFVVTQKQKNAILLTSNKFEIEQKGGTFTVEVKANVNYTATIGETCKEWITEGNDTRALSATTKTYSVTANEDSEKREGTITFTDGTLSETVHIYQAGGDIILLSKNEYNIDAAGEEITVELRSNCEYEVEMPKVDWIHAISTRAMSSHTLHYTIDANTTYDSRETKIVYRNKKKNVTETLTIVQAQKDAIILGKKTVEVKAEGETIKVKLSANVDYEVEMPDVDWITTKTTRGLTEHTLYYNVAKNEGDNSRSAQITFKNKEKEIEDILTVLQEGNRPTFVIDVPTAGKLPDITERRDFKALKLTGYLNGTDVRAINEMSELEYLDISGVHIVAGGGVYSIYGGNSYTKDNEIGEYMFYRTNLKKILLPNNVTTIKRYAFSRCSSLANIDIPNSVTTIERYAFGYCSSLTNIDIPNSVTTIESSAFEGCSSLTNIDIPNSVTTIGSCAFYGCSSLTNIDIPNSVTTIEGSAFMNCSSLTSINIPNSVTTIGSYAFYGCSSLTSIDIPNSVTTIESSAFAHCSSLTNIDIPNSVTTIGSSAFSGCKNLTIIKIGTGLISIRTTDLLRHSSITEVHCYATTVPASSNDDFEINKANAKLYIPKGTYQAYYLSNWGAKFTNIIEMEE